MGTVNRCTGRGGHTPVSSLPHSIQLKKIKNNLVYSTCMPHKEIFRHHGNTLDHKSKLINLPAQSPSLCRDPACVLVLRTKEVLYCAKLHPTPTTRKPDYLVVGPQREICTLRGPKLYPSTKSRGITHHKGAHSHRVSDSGRNLAPRSQAQGLGRGLLDEIGGDNFPSAVLDVIETVKHVCC